MAIALDAELNIISCNKNFIDQLKLKKEDFIKLPLSNIFKEKSLIEKIKSGKIKKIDLTLSNNISEAVKFNISPLLITSSSSGYFLIGKTVKVRKDWDQGLFQILKGTYNEVGNDFFKSITKELAKTLGMKYAFIGEISNFGANTPLVETVTFWNETKFKSNFSYNLEGSPCENVIDRKQLIVSDNVADLYPNDLGLSKLGVKSYIGTPIYYKDGTPMGIVVVMDTKPIHISEEDAYKLHLFANRIGTEMEWVKNDIALAKQESKLRTTIKSLPNPVYVQNNEGIYENCNDAFLAFFGIIEADIINKPLSQLPKVISTNEILSATHKKRKSLGINRIETTLETNAKGKRDTIIIMSPIENESNERTGIVGVIQDISEMKEAEKLLKIREEKYRTLFNSANDAFLLMRNDIIIDCNSKALEMFGCSREHFIGSKPYIFSPNTQPDKKNSKTKALEKINEAISGKPLAFYWKHKKYGGELFDAEVSLNAFNIKDELLLQAIVRDVSENVKATKAIESQTARMEKMYKLTSDTHTPFDEKVNSILKMATESLGMQIGGISVVEGKNYDLINHFSLIPFSANDINYLSETYCSITIKENRLIAIPNFSKSKYSTSEAYKLLQLESYIGVPYWVNGEVRGTILFTSFYGITEFKSFDSDFVQIIGQWIGSSIERLEYEEKLRKNEAVLETLLREIPVDFSVRDAQLKMLWQSNKSKEVWGDNEGKIIDFHDVDKVSADKWKDILNRVLKGETIKGENDVKIYGKSYSFHSIASPITVQGKVEQVTIIHIDISQLKKDAKKLKSQNNKLKKLNTELDRFVYSASHDLRAPLASLLGLIDLSQREDLNPAIEQYLKLMNTSIIKLDSFISDITDYSRNLRLKSKVEKIDFQAFITDIYNNLVYMNPDKMDFKLNISSQYSAYSDTDRLKLILNNLLSNSIRYRAYSQKLLIVVDVIIEKDDIQISITDNGLGIQKEYQEKVFEMFYRASDQNTGSGLGLFIVKETIDKLKGKIKLESVINKGTTFTISIPNQKL